MEEKTAAEAPGRGIRKIFKPLLRRFDYGFLVIIILLNVALVVAAILSLETSLWTLWPEDDGAQVARADAPKLPTECSLGYRTDPVGTATNPNDSESWGLIRLNLGSGVVDGYYFDVGRNIARALTASREQAASPQIRVIDLSTKGSLDNINCALDGKIQLFIAQSDTVQQFGDHREGTCRIEPEPLFNVYRETVTVLARSDVRASKLRDLEGLEICLPVQGSGSHQNALGILEIALKNRFKNSKPEGLHYSECMLALEDGRFDAMLYTIKHPHSPLLRFSDLSSEQVQFVSIEEDARIEGLDLERCEEAIKVEDYPNIASWTEPDDIGASKTGIGTYCTVAAVYHTDCIGEEMMKTLRERLREAGYNTLVPAHLREPRYAQEFMTTGGGEVYGQSGAPIEEDAGQVDRRAESSEKSEPPAGR